MRPITVPCHGALTADRAWTEHTYLRPLHNTQTVGDRPLSGAARTDQHSARRFPALGPSWDKEPPRAAPRSPTAALTRLRPGNRTGTPHPARPASRPPGGHSHPRREDLDAVLARHGGSTGRRSPPPVSPPPPPSRDAPPLAPPPHEAVPWQMEHPDAGAVPPRPARESPAGHVSRGGAGRGAIGFRACLWHPEVPTLFACAALSGRSLGGALAQGGLLPRP